jgi:hypothetical protein
LTRPRPTIVAELTAARARVAELDAELALLDPAPVDLAELADVDADRAFAEFDREAGHQLLCQCDPCLNGATDAPAT